MVGINLNGTEYDNTCSLMHACVLAGRVGLGQAVDQFPE